jgi:hypothetical protein
MNSLKKLTVALVCIFASYMAFAQTYNPVLKVSKGQEYNYKMDMAMETVQSMGGQEMKFASNISSTLKNSIENVLSNGNIEIIISLWDTKISSKILKDTSMTYSGQLGPSTKISINKFGNVIARSKMEGTTAIDPNFSGLENATNTVLFCEFPETPLKEGDKWTKEHVDSIAAGTLGKLNVKTKSEYKLGTKETVDGKSLYKVTCTSSMEISGKGNIQGMDFVVEGKGVKNDAIYLDPATGVVFSNKSKTEMDMNLAITGQQNMTIPITQKISTSYVLIK